MLTWDQIDLVPTGQDRAGLPLFRPRQPVRYFINGSLLATVDTDYETDRTSWPKPMRWYLRWIPVVDRWMRDERGRYDPGALLHDYLLDRTSLPKWQVDWLYKGVLRASGVSSLEAWIFYNTVRLKRAR